MKAERILRFHLSWTTAPLLAFMIAYVGGDLLAQSLPGGVYRLEHSVPVFKVVLFVATAWYLVESLGQTNSRLMVERGPAITVIALAAWLAYELGGLARMNPSLVIGCGTVILIWVVFLAWCGAKYRRSHRMRVVSRKIA